MDPLDLADPIRLVILALPERYRAPAAVLISTLAATQLIAASIIARLPLSAREHPRYGRVVRALHWYSLLRMRDEKGTTKPIGDNTGPRVTVAPTRADEVALPRPTAPDAITTLRSRTLTGREGERGSVDVRAMLALVVGLSVVVALGVAFYGCPVVNRDPTIEPPPAPADAGTTTCHNGAPWRFSAGAWSQADRQCNRLATDASAVVCCLTPSALRPDASVHACVPMTLCSPEVTP